MSYQMLVIVGHRDGCAMQVLTFETHPQASTAMVHLEQSHDRLPDVDILVIPLWETIEG